MDKLRTALAVAFLVCAVSITAVGRQPSPSHRHRQRAHHARRVSKTRPAASAAAGRQASSPHPLRRQARHGRRISKKQPAMSAAVVSATLVDELQPTPSAIAMYQDGRLALTAEDVPLGDILERIGESTGAVIEAPVLEERVSVQLDPQPPVQAIAALFEGMHLNYAILGGTSDQDPLQQIIVTLKAAPGSQSDVPNRGPGAGGTAVEAWARAMARFAEETGGDEGVWDKGLQSSPKTGASSSTAGASVRANR
ncbi:MAG: hypothetical protein ABR988_06220 [Terriglobales bacterium]